MSRQEGKTDGYIDINPLKKITATLMTLIGERWPVAVKINVRTNESYLINNI